MGFDFSVIKTQRLLLRPVRTTDTEALVARRNHPEAAAFQDWALPYTRETAAQTIAAMQTLAGPRNNEWWMLSIANLDDNIVYGDLSFRLEWSGRCATVGYSLARDHWGHGYATEALGGLLDWLFCVQRVTRVGATLHPDNLRSAKVLERCGFDFEGHTQNSFWSGDENTDDWIYGLTPTRRHHWNSRPTSQPKKIELIEPYPTGLRDVVKLKPHQSQMHFVAPIAASLAQVAVPPFEEGDNPQQRRVKPWPRVIHADDEPVGFVMLESPTASNPHPFLWRFIIDRHHQGRGIGWNVLEMITEQVRNWGCESLLVSWVEGYGSPGPLYKRFGFEPTGETDHNEIIGRLRLTVKPLVA